MRPARPGTRLPSARPGSPLKPPSAGLGPPFTSGDWERPPLRRPRLSGEGDSGKGALRRRRAVLAGLGRRFRRRAAGFSFVQPERRDCRSLNSAADKSFPDPSGTWRLALRRSGTAVWRRWKGLSKGRSQSTPGQLAGARPEPFAYRNRLPGRPRPGSGPLGDQRPRLHPRSRSLGRSRSAVGGRACDT